jgi:MFS family permease
MRGLVTALYAFIVSIVGLAVAPTVVALLTDYVFGDPTKVNYSLGIVVTASAIVALWLSRSAVPHFRPLVSPQQADEGAILVD